MAKELVYIDRQNLVDTADALRERLSTTDTYSVSEFADAIQEIQGGIDTSDANVQASEIIENKIAYAKGKKIIGTMGTFERYLTVDSSNFTPSNNFYGGNYYLSFSDFKPTPPDSTYLYINRNDTPSVEIPGECFGDAQTDDVLQGKTFSSKNGMKREGTLVVNKYYTGSSEPSSSLGNNGDFYLMTVLSSDDIEEDNPFAP